MLSAATDVALGLVAVAMLLAFWRLLRGPSAPDRILALDTLYVNAVAALLVLGVRLGDDVYFESALVIGLLGFVGTVAMAAYVRRGRTLE